MPRRFDQLGRERQSVTSCSASDQAHASEGGKSVPLGEPGSSGEAPGTKESQGHLPQTIIEALSAAEEALRKSEERYRAVVEDQTEVICRFNIQGTLTFVSEVYCRFFGKSSQELLGSNWQPRAVSEDLPLIERQLRAMTPTNPIVVVENRVYAADGRVRWMQFVNRGFFDNRGRLTETQAVGRDITDRKLAEQDLRRSEERLQLVMRAVNDGVWDWDLPKGLAYLSPRYYEMIGYEPREVVADMEFYKRLIHPEDLPAVLQTMNAHLEGRTEESVVEYRLITKDGAIKWILGKGKVVERNATGAPLRMVGTISDITERRRLETERAAALARLAVAQDDERHRLSGELHDQTAQRLVALAVELKNLETSLAAGRPQAERVRSLREAVGEIQQQVRQIAWDLRAGEQVEGGLERALREYAEEWSERAQVSLDCESRGFGSERLPARVEATLYRVAQEALANVLKHAGARRVSVLLERDETLVRLTVEDDGRGFDVEAVQKSFDAAQRLGLLTMKERVALAGGTVLIESSPSAGTTILVRIPISNPSRLL